MPQNSRKDASEESLLDKSKRRYEETYKDLTPVNADPELMTLSGADEAAANAASQTKED